MAGAGGLCQYGVRRVVVRARWHALGVPPLLGEAPRIIGCLESGPVEYGQSTAARRLFAAGGGEFPQRCCTSQQ